METCHWKLANMNQLYIVLTECLCFWWRSLTPSWITRIHIDIEPNK